MTATSKSTGADASPHPVIHDDICKGCGRCIAFCPKKVLRFKSSLNRRGVHPAEYAGSGCSGCGHCFYNCPEPFALEIHSPDPKTESRKRDPQP